MKKHISFIFILVSNVMMTSSQTVYLFSHGLANYGERQMHAYMQSYRDQFTGLIKDNELYLIPNNPASYKISLISDTIFHSFDYADALCFPPFVNPFKTNLGQIGDVTKLKQEYDFVCDQYPDANIILFGMSRGATTIINFLGIHKPERVAAVIVESPFDCGQSIFAAVQKQLGTNKTEDEGQALLEFVFKEYNRNGLQAIDYVAKIPHHIPILFICSKEDQRVPYISTQKLYNILLQAGHEHCYLFTADYGRHFDILWNKHGLIYQSVVHSFYKHYNLPYEKVFAKHADLLLKRCK